MGPAREVEDDGGKKKVRYPYLPFLSLSKTERGSLGNLPKIKSIVVHYHIILKSKPAKSLLFNSVHP